MQGVEEWGCVGWDDKGVRCGGLEWEGDQSGARGEVGMGGGWRRLASGRRGLEATEVN